MFFINSDVINYCIRHGSLGGTRTPTPIRAERFKRSASAIPPLGHVETTKIRKLTPFGTDAFAIPPQGLRCIPRRDSNPQTIADVSFNVNLQGICFMVGTPGVEPVLELYKNSEENRSSLLPIVFSIYISDYR